MALCQLLKFAPAFFKSTTRVNELFQENWSKNTASLILLHVRELLAQQEAGLDPGFAVGETLEASR